MKGKKYIGLLFGMLVAASLFTTSCGKDKEEMKKEDAVQEEIQQNVPESSMEEIIVNSQPEEQPEVPVSEEPVKESEPEICQVVHCNEFITLRTQPATDAAEICKIPLGADVNYLGNGENGFVRVSYDGKEGYALASYLNFTKEDGAIFMKVYNCNESITLRKIPSTTAEEFCQIPLGEKVIFRETAQDGFDMHKYAKRLKKYDMENFEEKERAFAAKYSLN